MYERVEVSSNVKIYFIVVAITIMIRRLHDDSAGKFWCQVEYENVKNPDFENIKHLQSTEHLSMTAPSICCGIYYIPVNVTEWHTTKILHKQQTSKQRSHNVYKLNVLT